MKKNISTNKSRRDFIKYGSLAASGFFIVPRHVLGGNGYQAPSDTLNIGGIGVGGSILRLLLKWEIKELLIPVCLKYKNGLIKN